MQHMNLPPSFAGGLVNWRLRILHRVAQALGLLVKVEGFPYGTTRNLGWRVCEFGGIDRVSNPHWRNAAPATPGRIGGVGGEESHQPYRPESSLHDAMRR